MKKLCCACIYIIGYLQIMTDTVKDPGIKKCCLVPNRLTDLQNLSDGLERCQKSLNDYLDSKRNAFPRFFFISDDELLSILGSSEPTCVQEHMIKVLLPCLHYRNLLLLCCISHSQIISCRTALKPSLSFCSVSLHLFTFTLHLPADV